MKIIELRVKDIPSNIKRNYKLIIVVIAICICIGVICGLMSAKSYSPKNEVQVSQLQEHVELDSIEKDGGYYYSAFFDLKEKNDYIKAYLRYFEQVDISNESRSLLEEIEKSISEYQESYDDARKFYEENAPVIFEKKEAAVKFYNEKIDDLEKNKKENKSKLQEIVDGNYTSDYKQSQQDNIASDISNLQNDIDMFNQQVSIIETSSQAEIEENSVSADNILQENSNQLNGIIDDFNDTLRTLAENENYEIIYNKRLINDYFEDAGFNGEMEQEDILENQLGEAIIYAKSIAGLDLRSERFFATFTFFVLFGIVLGAIVGAVYKAPKGRKGYGEK